MAGYLATPGSAASSRPSASWCAAWSPPSSSSGRPGGPPAVPLSAGSPAVAVGLEKTLAFNVSGHVLHSIFWKNLSPDGGDKPNGDLASAIDEHFGSFDGFHAQLTQATTTIQGSGWGVLAWEPLGQRLLVEQVYDHQGNIGNGSVPLLVFDAWEHAFYLQYKNVKADFVTALWKIVNWDDVNSRFAQARKLAIS